MPGTRTMDPLPEIDLRQLLCMTDDTGLLQHALFGVPDHRHGYCTDDNSRALIAGLIHAQLRGYDERHVPLRRYLGFLAYALNPEAGRFRNFMSYAREWLEEVGSEDSHGRALWALGVATELAPNDTILSYFVAKYIDGADSELGTLGNCVQQIDLSGLVGQIYRSKVHLHIDVSLPAVSFQDSLCISRGNLRVDG